MAATKASTPKAKTTTASGGVKKHPGAPKGGFPRKANKARNAMVAMQAYFKKHRHEFKDLDFKDQQKELGKKWKTAPENPKASA
ncbi:hypothetical protein K491DRAFT_711706 [Lophiostoma macrostomum CBS 122681]|uniref:Uncharacterized protein n=1 Tax=Lophiostoma macrostomum CBS 122681 TaxID=1314788 RepID=A0A6A6TMR1_9PLEO|nr:hypothetical protein K491DRAFT_711706 [Lophiostoma macrostomum CBS 122681]